MLFVRERAANFLVPGDLTIDNFNPLGQLTYQKCRLTSKINNFGNFYDNILIHFIIYI